MGSKDERVEHNNLGSSPRSRAKGFSVDSGTSSEVSLVNPADSPGKIGESRGPDTVFTAEDGGLGGKPPVNTRI
jgi:hypothetical protein